MMKVAILFLLVVASCYAGFFTEKNIRALMKQYAASEGIPEIAAAVGHFSEKRQDFTPPCFKIQCVPSGQSCNNDAVLPAPCGKCVNETTDCITQNVISGNTTGLCGCWTKAVNCFKAATQCAGASFLNGLGAACLFTNQQLELDCECPPFDPTKFIVVTCGPGTYCSGDTLKCTNQVAVGGTCDTDDQCKSDATIFSNRQFQCIGDKCELQDGWAGVGDACATTDDCANNVYVTCENKVCVGVAEGESCSTNADCAYGLYCPEDTDKCTKRIKVGSACVSGTGDDANGCEPFADCVDDKCVAEFSVAKGGDCISDAPLCKAGLQCVNGKCSDPFVPTECTTDPGKCTGDTVCTCDQFTGKSFCVGNDDLGMAFPASCQTTAESFFSCMSSAKCSDLNTDPGSCAVKNCAEEVGCVLSCITQIEPYKSFIATGCFNVPDTCSSGTDTDGTEGSSASVVGFVFALVLVMVAILI